MNTKTLYSDTVQELGEQINHICNSHFKPGLAIVFCSTGHDLEALQSVFTSANIKLAGCTTAGEIHNDQIIEHSIVTMLLEVNQFDTVLVSYEEGGVYESSLKLGEIAKQKFDQPSLLVFSAGFTVDAELMMKGVFDGIGQQVPIYGGLAGDDLKMLESSVFTHDSISSFGLVGLIFNSEKIQLEGKAISGWKPIGGVNTVTKASGNVVLEINHERAYDLFARYFGFASPSLSENERLISLQTNYPFQFIREEGYQVLRSPMIVNKDDGSIVLTSSVKEGEKFRFSSSPGFEIIQQTINDFGDLFNEAPDADAVIMFSCKGRQGAFGPMLNREIEGIYNYWKKPMIGFLSYGEIGKVSQQSVCEFHNETCSLVLLKEI